MKKTRNIMIGAGVLFFTFLLLFAIYAGTRIGTDLGEFIYNLQH